jgi:putative MATE family efflux protein
MANNFGKNLTEGSVPKKLLLFSLPILLANFLFTGYSIINTIWVGNILGDNAVGALAVSYPVTLFLIAVAQGITIATSVLISQYYGAKENQSVEKTVFNSFLISIILTIILTITGLCLADTLLRMMNTPQSIFGMASAYLKINLIGFVFTYLYFLFSSILRGIGITVTPLLILAVSTCLNAVLDPLLIIGIGPFPKLGLNGAAIASLISQGIAFIIGYGYIVHKYPVAGFRLKGFPFDWKVISLIFKIGIPTIIQQTLVSIGSAFVTTFVNNFGDNAITAFGAVSKIESMVVLLVFAMSMSVATFTGQNLGAQKHERVKEIFKWGIILNLCAISVIIILSLLVPKIMLLMFVHHPAVLNIGITYLRISCIGYILLAVTFVSNGIINGSGRTIITMTITLISLWVVRIPLAGLLAKTSLGLMGIWIAIICSIMVTMLISLGYYFSGRWVKLMIRNHAKSI